MEFLCRLAPRIASLKSAFEFFWLRVNPLKQRNRPRRPERAYMDILKNIT